MAMLQCEIVTPTHVVYRGEAALVQVPSAGGYAGILPGHEPFSCRMMNGIVTVFPDADHKEKLEFASYMGFAQVFDNKVTVLCRQCNAVNEIDVAAVQAEAAALKAKIDAMSPEEMDEQRRRAEKVQRHTLIEDLEWCEVQLNYAAK